jgi:diguanylate cyclase
MLNTKQPIQGVIINESGQSNCVSIKSGMMKRAEITQLQKRIGELESELEMTRVELIRERYHANIDLLTNIPNRRAYQIRLQEERLRCQRDRKPLCLAIWDIDHFKSINDRFGHQAGDKVLQCVAKQITGRLRRSDFTARIGGEEFVSLLPDCDTKSALRLANELRNNIHCCDFDTKLGPVQVTLSCGIAMFDPTESDEALFALADAALYRAKAGGRNRVCLAR